MSLERIFQTPPGVRYETVKPQKSHITLNHIKNVLNRVTYSHRKLEDLYNQLHRVGAARNRIINKMMRAGTEYQYHKAFTESLRIIKIYSRIWKQIHDIEHHQRKVIHRLTAGHAIADFMNKGPLTNRERNLIVRLLQFTKNVSTAQRTLIRTNLPEDMQREIRLAIRNSYIRNIRSA